MWNFYYRVRKESPKNIGSLEDFGMRHFLLKFKTILKRKVERAARQVY